MRKFTDNIITAKLSITIDNYISINGVEYTFNDEIVLQLLEKTKSLMLSHDAYNLFNDIPRYITKLCIDFPDYDDININGLPDGLIELSIMAEAGGDFNKPLDNLPRTLELLCIVSQKFNQSLDNLPYSLKTLMISSDAFTNSLSNLPINLEMLEYILYFDETNDTIYKNNMKSSHDLLNLPLTLKQLVVSRKHSYQYDMPTIRAKHPNLEIIINIP